MYFIAIRHKPDFEEYLDEYLSKIQTSCFLSSTGTLQELARIYQAKCQLCGYRDADYEFNRNESIYSVFGSRDLVLMKMSYENFINRRMEPYLVAGTMLDFFRTYRLRCRQCHQFEQRERDEESSPPALGASLTEGIVERNTRDAETQTPKSRPPWNVTIRID